MPAGAFHEREPRGAQRSDRLPCRTDKSQTAEDKVRRVQEILAQEDEAESDLEGLIN